MKELSEKARLKLLGLLSNARHESLNRWRDAWQMWPGAAPLLDVATSWARQLEQLNDVQIELGIMVEYSQEWLRQANARTYEIGIERTAIRCLLCGHVSHNPHDIENLYCGYCHRFHSGQ